MGGTAASPEVEAYKRQLRKHLGDVAPIFTRAAAGDFSQNVKIPTKEDELTVFLVGLQIILDAIREKVKESESALGRLNTANIALQHEKAVDEAILSSMAEGLIVVDKDARITVVNQTAAKMLGQDAEAMIGCNYYDLVVTKDKQGVVVPIKDRPLHQALTKGHRRIKTLADGLHYVHTTGLLIPVAITTSPVKLGDQIIGGVTTFRDISEEKLMDRTKSEIISIASHQLRTPLTAIKWVSEQLLRPASKMNRSVRRKYLRQLHSSNERMITLVNDLLNVSRVELGTLSIEPKPFDLSAMLDDVIRDLGSQIKAKRLRIRKSISPKLDTITSDPRHFQVILQNLLSNAVRYSPEKQSIYVSIAEQDHKLCLTIKDHGYGIPKLQQGKIFTKLFRADNARQMVSEGSGLGLYVCRAMVEQLDGRVWFESIENKGSTFYVELPYIKPDTQAKPKQ